MLLGCFLVLSSMAVSAQSSGEKVKVKASDKNQIQSAGVKQQPAEVSQKSVGTKFRMTQADYNQLSPAKKEYISRNPELFIITKEN